jgi:2-oxo-4-hydroxy-4-carboxy-5-ureidoimidazoline decarboxylase
MDASGRLDTAGDDDARMLLGRCCGAERWVEAMLARRPFVSDDRLLALARDVWFNLTPDDWREAFAHHPRIGDRASLQARFPKTHHLSEREQAAVALASDVTLAALERSNLAYEERFGYTFIVCATGKTAEEMLNLLEERFDNPPEIEIRTAAEEQARITAVRLASLSRD